MIIDRIALILSIVGALNWGGIGLFGFDTVAFLCGGQMSVLSRVIYALVGLAGLLFMTRLNCGQPNEAEGLEFDAITGAIIGGTSMAGGKGKVINTLVGVLVIIVINMALTYMNVQTEMQKVFQGGIILLAVVLDAYFGKLESEVH